MYFIAGFAVALAMGASISAVGDASRAPAEPFAVAGITYAEATDFLQRLRRAVRENDAGAIGVLTHFPLIVNGKRGPQNAAELAQQFAEIYTERVRGAVLGQTVDGLFVNWRGLIIGRGEVWFSALCDTDGVRGTCKNRRILVVQVNNSFKPMTQSMAPSNNRWRAP